MALPELSRMLAEMFGQVERARVARNPHANRKTTLADAGKSGHRYYETTNGKGQRVRFCRSVHRNIAGFFVIWREVTMKNGRISNSMLRAFKCKKTATATNLKRYKAALAKKAQ